MRSNRLLLTKPQTALRARRGEARNRPALVTYIHVTFVLQYLSDARLGDYDIHILRSKFCT